MTTRVKRGHGGGGSCLKNIWIVRAHWEDLDHVMTFMAVIKAKVGLGEGMHWWCVPLCVVLC